MAAAAVPTTTYCNRADLESKLSAYGVQGMLDDDADGQEDTDSEAGQNQAIYHGANRVNFYLLGKYAASELALSPIACEFAILLSCCWLCKRRGNPCPMQAECDHAEALMKEIRDGEALLPDAAPRATGLPSHLNTRIDRNYPLGKTRVIRPESDQTPPDHAQRVDYPAEFYHYR